MTERFVMAVNQGTTSTRCILFDHHGRMVSVTQREHKQHFPKPGWVEHDAVEIWRNFERIAPEALAQAGITLDQVAALGITNQRETTLMWDRHTGEPVGRALVWQDTRTDTLVDEMSRLPMRTSCRSAAVCRWRPIFPPPASGGCSTTFPGWTNAPRTVASCSGRWRAG